MKCDKEAVKDIGEAKVKVNGRLENFHENLNAQLHEQVMEKVESLNSVEEEDLYRIIDEVLTDKSCRGLDVKVKAELRRELFNAIKRLDILQEIIDDDSITEVMINGYRDIFVEKEGRIVKYDKCFASEEKLMDIIQRIAARSNKIVNESLPIIDTRLEDGSRCNIVMKPVSIDGPAVTIRKFYNNPLSMDSLIEFGSITKEASEFLKNLVESKYNIFISGGTGSGKTTFLNVLSNYIPKDERVVTIEDSAELKLMGIENIVRLEARNANMEGKNAISIRDMIKASLRMRHDRIIVGEVRAEEALDMLQAMNTGHDGSLSTGHANGPEEMLIRLETMVLMAMEMPISAIRNQLASAIDIIVHLGRLRDGSRRVFKICEVDGITPLNQGGNIRLNTLYEFCEEGMDERGKIKGTLKKSNNRLIHTEKLLKRTTE